MDCSGQKTQSTDFFFFFTGKIGLVLSPSSINHSALSGQIGLLIGLCDLLHRMGCFRYLLSPPSISCMGDLSCFLLLLAWVIYYLVVDVRCGQTIWLLVCRCRGKRASVVIVNFCGLDVRHQLSLLTFNMKGKVDCSYWGKIDISNKQSFFRGMGSWGQGRAM